MRGNSIGVAIVAAITAGTIGASNTLATAATPTPQNDIPAWASGPARLLMLPDEIDLLGQLSDPEFAQQFVDWFWARRDPEPLTPVNEFRREFRDRVAFVDKEYGDGQGSPGWATARGRIYLLMGRPEATFTTARQFFIDGALRALSVWEYRDRRTSGRIVRFAFVRTASGTHLASARRDTGLELEQLECLRTARQLLVHDPSPGRFGIVEHPGAEPLPMQAVLTTNANGIMARLTLPLTQLFGQPEGNRIRYRFRIVAQTAEATPTRASDLLEITIGPDEFRTWSDQMLHIAVWLPPAASGIRVIEQPTGRTAAVPMRATVPGGTLAVGRKLGVAPLLGGRGVAVAYFPVCPERHPRAEAVLVDAADPDVVVTEPLPGGQLALALPPDEGR